MEPYWSAIDKARKIVTELQTQNITIELNDRNLKLPSLDVPPK